MDREQRSRPAYLRTLRTLVFQRDGTGSEGRRTKCAGPGWQYATVDQRRPAGGCRQCAKTGPHVRGKVGDLRPRQTPRPTTGPLHEGYTPSPSPPGGRAPWIGIIGSRSQGLTAGFSPAGQVTPSPKPLSADRPTPSTFGTPRGVDAGPMTTSVGLTTGMDKETSFGRDDSRCAISPGSNSVALRRNLRHGDLHFNLGRPGATGSLRKKRHHDAVDEPPAARVSATTTPATT